MTSSRERRAAGKPDGYYLPGEPPQKSDASASAVQWQGTFLKTAIAQARARAALRATE